MTDVEDTIPVLRAVSLMLVERDASGDAERAITTALRILDLATDQLDRDLAVARECLGAMRQQRHAERATGRA